MKKLSSLEAKTGGLRYAPFIYKTWIWMLKAFRPGMHTPAALVLSPSYILEPLTCLKCFPASESIPVCNSCISGFTDGETEDKKLKDLSLFHRWIGAQAGPGPEIPFFQWNTHTSGLLASVCVITESESGPRQLSWVIQNDIFRMSLVYCSSRWHPSHHFCCFSPFPRWVRQWSNLRQALECLGQT